MNQNKLLGLAVAGCVALGAGWYFGAATRPDRGVAMDTGKLMFPDLAPKLQDARRIEITSKGKVTVIERKDGIWGLADRGGYRVLDSKLRGMLTTLTELRLTEPRTTDPAQFARLGVEDPTAEKEGTANLLRVLDADGKPILSVIVGHRRMRTQGHVPEQVYVRLPGDNQSWLAEGGLQADTDPQVWLDRDVLNIAPATIVKVVAANGESRIEFTRDGEKLKVTVPAEYPKLEDYKIDDVARALESLTFQDVKSDKEPIGEKAGESMFTTADGLEISVTVNRLDKDSWTRFRVTATGVTPTGVTPTGVTAPGTRQADAEKLNAKLAGWAFQTGQWKEKAFIPTLDDLKAPPPEPVPAPAAGVAPAPAPATVSAPAPAPAPASAPPAADPPK